jgi:hypothetical protein
MSAVNSLRERMLQTPRTIDKKISVVPITCKGRYIEVEKIKGKLGYIFVKSKIECAITSEINIKVMTAKAKAVNFCEIEPLPPLLWIRA